jgi:hypothetical protein
MHGISVLSSKSLLASRIKSDIEMYSDRQCHQGYMGKIVAVNSMLSALDHDQ